MLRCPKCDDTVQVNLPADSGIDDMADLSRHARKVRKGQAVELYAGASVGLILCAGCGYEGDPLEFDPRSLLPKVEKCYITTKGMVIAFDGAGKQVPECQGFILAVASELKIRCDEKTQWHFGKTGSWLEKADFGWWFRDE